MTKERFEHFETVRVPEVARVTGDIVAAVEGATPEQPVSIDIFAKDEGGIVKVLEKQLESTDVLYDRHAAVFFDDDKIYTDNVNFEDVLALSKDIVNDLNVQTSLRRRFFMGFGLLQIADAGVRMARDPSLTAIDLKNENLDAAIAAKAGQMSFDAFQTTFAQRIRGNMDNIPGPRLSYLGHLAETHYSFWRAKLQAKGVPTDMYEDVQKLLPRFPAKVMSYDVHASLGRPDRTVARRAYEKKMQAFRESLLGGEVKGAETKGNIKTATEFAFQALDQAIRSNLSPEEALRIVVQESAEIGRTTERTSNGLDAGRNETIRFQETDEGLQLELQYEKPEYESFFSDATVEKLQRRDEKAGICPARYPIPLSRGGEVHENIKEFAVAVKDRIGVDPPLLREVGGQLYVDPAALTINYALLAIADNYYAT